MTPVTGQLSEEQEREMDQVARIRGKALEMEALLRDLLSAVTEMYEDGIIRADSLTPAFLSAERHATALLSSLDQEKP